MNYIKKAVDLWISSGILCIDGGNSEKFIVKFGNRHRYSKYLASLGHISIPIDCGSLARDQNGFK